MRRAVVAAAVLAATLLSLSVLAQGPSGTLVTIDVWYPQSNVGENAQMSIAGTAPFSWSSPMGPLPLVDTDHWQLSFHIPDSVMNASFPTYTIGFKVLIEGAFEMGANHQIFLSVGKNGSKTIYPYFQTAEGQQFTIKDVYSPQLNNTRDVWIFAPPAMVENPYFESANTIVMQDGQNLAPLWQIPQVVNQLWAAEDLEQIFFIGPYNTPDRIAEYTYSKSAYYGGGKGDLYLDWVYQTLLPRVRQDYNFSMKKAHLGIGGSSLGGLISCYAAVTRPAEYGKAICMSSSFWWNNGDFLGTIVPQLTKDSAASQVYYIDSGDSGVTDDDMADTTVVATSFLTKGVGFILGQNFFWYMMRGGQHNEYYWSTRFHHPMQYLYQRPAVWNNQED